MSQAKSIKPAFVTLDRQIQVISGANDDAPTYKRISDIRFLPFCVILGEPGMGKTSVLKTEAAAFNVPVFTVQDVISNPPQPCPIPLFIDALDEFRIDGNARDKVHQLSSAIRSSGAQFWRLSCRAEDWRKEADIAAISKTTDGVPILVVQLMPLDDEEVVHLLTAFGEADPEQFMETARKFGADGLTENPLSLKLLHKSVSGSGLWPASRFELFERSILTLAHEENIEHGSDHERISAAAIISAAEQACLRLLITGAPALLRSNAERIVKGDGRRSYLATSEIPVAAKVLRDMLDTPLFRGEGEVFAPIHRTIAEFLAGRALAKLVAGAGTDSAIPLSRALALITSPDGAPPTELRGLYAWFAAHLAKLGDEAGCLELVQREAFTIIAYGDVSGLSASCRRAVLGNLSKDDPYFRVTFYGTTGLGALANADLAGDFEKILLDRNDSSHLKWTVLEALSQGAPIETLRPVLCSMILDPLREDWERTRALEAWVN